MPPTPTYHDRIRSRYDNLSRSYRRVADFILTNYYEVSFMTAAQLAYAVGVDTTTVVRFSQRLGYNGYPELLHDVRIQVRAEIYAAYSEGGMGSLAERTAWDGASTDEDGRAPEGVHADEGIGSVDGFRTQVRRDQHGLTQMLVHNPPEHVVRIAALLNAAAEVVLIGEGHTACLAQMAAMQLRQVGRQAWAESGEPARLAVLLTSLRPGALVVGISATAHGQEVARAMEYARTRGCATLGVVGSLSSPINRMSDLVLFAPTDAEGPLPSLVALASALSGLAGLATPAAAPPSDGAAGATHETVPQVYAWLVEPKATVPDDEP